jgi:hypothetical protein
MRLTRAEVYVEYFKTFWAVADERCRRYYGTEGPSGHAAGLESLAYFAGLVIELFPDSWETVTVIDAGAGVSSAILRTYFPNVISCDPDADYLRQVELACTEMGLTSGQWVVGVPTVSADATFYDYGTSERIAMFPRFLDLTKSVIWMDDAHDRELLDACAAVCEARGLQLRRARGAHDNLGRFGAYALPGGHDLGTSRPEPQAAAELEHEVSRLHTEWRTEFEARQRSQELLRLYETSLSWRLTRPLRAISALLH